MKLDKSGIRIFLAIFAFVIILTVAIAITLTSLYLKQNALRTEVAANQAAVTAIINANHDSGHVLLCDIIRAEHIVAKGCPK